MDLFTGRNETTAALDYDAQPSEVADALSGLSNIAGAVRVLRFDHSERFSYDTTTINTLKYQMEYIVSFDGVARPGDLPLLTSNQLDSVSCGNVSISEVLPGRSDSDSDLSVVLGHRPP
ncbi:unnamed protein product, partial [Choristocarpus tenellus]